MSEGPSSWRKSQHKARRVYGGLLHIEIVQDLRRVSLVRPKVMDSELSQRITRHRCGMR